MLSPGYESLLRKRLNDLDINSIQTIEEGWDSLVFEIDREWIIRLPRRPEVRMRLRKEVALLSELADTLPISVPRSEIVTDDHDVFLVRYRKLAGTRIDRALSGATNMLHLAEQLGGFLAALHVFPVGRAEALGVQPADRSRLAADAREFVNRCESGVLPLLGEDDCRRAQLMFEAFVDGQDTYEMVLTHADLGPAHILCRGDAVSGVIDWSNSRLGDPSRDFGWLLHGFNPAFANALLASYQRNEGPLDPGLMLRARIYHQLGPWWEVLHGLEEDKPEFIRSGLAGVRSRLR